MTVSAVRPCRTAFCRDRALPSSVRGPVLCRALSRLAWICLSDVMRSFCNQSCPSPDNRLFRGETAAVHGSRVGIWPRPNPDGCRRLVQSLARLAVLPERLGDGERSNTARLPPRTLFRGAMRLAVMRAAKRHGVFIADLAAERARLRKRQMMGVGRLLGANQVGLAADEFEVLLVAVAHGLGDRRLAAAGSTLLLKRRLRGCVSDGRAIAASRGLMRRGIRYCKISSKIARQASEPGFKGQFHGAGIIRGKGVLCPQHGVGPGRGCRRRGNASDLREHRFAKPG